MTDICCQAGFFVQNVEQHTDSKNAEKRVTGLAAGMI